MAPFASKSVSYSSHSESLNIRKNSKSTTFSFETSDFSMFKYSSKTRLVNVIDGMFSIVSCIIGKVWKVNFLKVFFAYQPKQGRLTKRKLDFFVWGKNVTIYKQNFISSYQNLQKKKELSIKFINFMVLVLFVGIMQGFFNVWTSFKVQICLQTFQIVFHSLRIFFSFSFSSICFSKEAKDIILSSMPNYFTEHTSKASFI